MNVVETLNVLGLCLSLIGIVILFNNSESPNSVKSKVTYMYSREELERIQAEEFEKEKVFNKRKRMGLMFAVCAVVTQLIALFIGITSN